jgi:hypothetical protein
MAKLSLVLPAAATEIAGVRGIWWAHGNRQCTGLGSDGCLGRSGGGGGGSNGTGEGEDDYESADDVFH